MERFFCDYDIVHAADIHEGNIPALNHIKAKIVNLHNQRLKTMIFGNPAADNLLGEQPTLYQQIGRQKNGAQPDYSEVYATVMA
jgi:hypothetical protein